MAMFSYIHAVWISAMLEDCGRNLLACHDVFIRNKLIVEEFSILAVSYIFIASASVKIADTYRNALYCDNCIYEEPESYNIHRCSACCRVIHEPPGAAKNSGEYKFSTGSLWFSNRTI
jgi:hypothetical protein